MKEQLCCATGKGAASVKNQQQMELDVLPLFVEL